MKPQKLRRVLFICKHNECYGFTTYTRRSAGLFNSTRFIVEALVAKGLETRIVEVADNNAIDREVALFKPDYVVIEALWVVPEKFDILKRLHPRVRWFCHLHSNIPFLALEGIAIEWIFKYARKEIGLIANSEESFDALSTILREHELRFLPNVYMTIPRTAVLDRSKEFVDVGCFGAVRPLKNHLIQAMAAIQFARDVRKSLRFHINATRLEMGGGQYSRTW